MDAFYAACEELRRPELRGRALIVGADPAAGRGRGVVVACNYAARGFGVRSGMPIRDAWERAPQAAYVSPQHGYYSEVGRRVFEDLRASFPLDRASIDEAFVDATLHTTWTDALAFAAALHRRVERVTGGLTCSIGVGPNKLLAKVASGHEKPNATTIVLPAHVQDFLDPLPVGQILFIGPKTTRRLAELGIHRVIELRARPRDQLVGAFGAHGAYMHDAANGRDEAPVLGAARPGRSMSHEKTFLQDTRSRSRLMATLRRMMEGLERELRDQGNSYRTVAVKVRYADFTTLTRQASLAWPTPDTMPARRVVPQLLETALRDSRAVRLIGLRLGALSRNHHQRSLFDYRA